MGLKQAFKYLTVVATGTLLLICFSHSQNKLIHCRDRNYNTETRIVQRLDAILTSPLQQQNMETPLSKNCLQLQQYITELIKAHHPDSVMLLSNKQLFRSTRADSKTNAIDCYSGFSLKSFHAGLYARAKMVFSNHTCYNNHTVMPDFRDLLIYSPYHTDLHNKADMHSVHTDIHSAGNIRLMSGNHNDNAHSKTSHKSDVIKVNITDVDLVLLTSMYHSIAKQYIFINTLINWSNLTTPSRLQPVLFLTHMDIVEKSGILLYVAYLRGWIIAVAPHCLTSRYPLLHSMFLFGGDVVPHAHWIGLARDHWKYIKMNQGLFSVVTFIAYWYGYANGDIQFTPTFMKTLSKINQYNAQVKDADNTIGFISSRRTDVNVARGELHPDPNDIITLSEDIKPVSGIAVDLFVYHTNSTDVFKKMPRFAVGRRGFDNWLINDILRRHLGAVDITGTSPMVHLGIQGLSNHQNSHRTRKQDSEYNMHIINDKNWIKKVDHIGTVSTLERTGRSNLQTGWDLCRQWLTEERNIKFTLKSRDEKNPLYIAAWKSVQRIFFFQNYRL